MLNDTRLLLTNEVARILDVSPDTVRLWERVGRLPALKTPGGVRLFAQRDVEQLALERSAHRGESAAGRRRL
jgi:excisionase family DNA binding protein